ncbi:hypothetical protein K431DRAFT_220801 [Polychaeton citri CBS 116435]|uniref:DUF7820 domain-containing protein n=1 Tax=Polychaeton citri CBS 116435 TaxID=1314669 RepID=A0A9P4Q9H7_9PEZI|nr:hypothetical protein K431DRAFT_220801 [Polychaeton citri CBS 116435]
MDRRSPPPGHETPVLENPDVFDDEFEVFDGVADGMLGGFGSGHDREARRQSWGRESEGQRTPPIRSVSAHFAPSSSDMPSRSSIQKPRPRGGSGDGTDNPFFSADDDDDDDDLLHRVASMQSSSTANYAPGNVAHRSLSSASSSHNFARSNSPRIGAGGPSHPYGMYPQGTVARTPSVATQSTIRAPAHHGSEAGAPQHPYALYPQGVAEDDDEDQDLIAATALPVGFPGQDRSYQRRIGPDGEEQDIIGVDGHLEQLPPYSRYPEEGLGDQKMPLLAAPTPLHSRAPVAGSDPSMPLMHDIPDLTVEHRRRPQSMMDESDLARHGSRPSMSNLEQMASRETFSSSNTDKTWKEKNWKEKRKTRFCGIPFWWLLLTACVLAFIALVLGAVIGGFLGGQRHESKKLASSSAAVLTVMSTLYDASIIPTPTNLSPPTGTYALAFNTAEHVQSECLVDEGQEAAWSCDLGGSPAMALGVSPLNGGNGPLQARLMHASQDTTLYYGALQDYMSTSQSPFLTVTDNDDPDFGPAFYFQATYDKVVVVPDGSISGKVVNNGNFKDKRDYSPYSIPTGWLQQQQNPAEAKPQPSSQPWLCVWNQTFIEGFIYVQKPVSSSSVPSSSSSSSPNLSATSTTTQYMQATSPSTVTSDYWYPSHKSHDWPNTQYTSTSDPGTTSTTTLPLLYTTATFIGEPSTYPQWSSDVSSDSAEAKEKPKLKRITARDLFDGLPTYPYIIKIEERRLPSNDIQPYCQQVQILDNGSWGWYGNGSSKANTIMLEEQDPQYGAYESAGIAGSKSKRGLYERQTVPGGCHCQWMSGME